MTSSPGIIGRRRPVRPSKGLCFCCREPFQPTFYKRMWPTTRLERFLQSAGVGITPLLHQFKHVRERHGAHLDLSHEELNQIRKGDRRPTWNEAVAVQFAVSSLLGVLIPMAELFDETEVAPR